MNTILLLGVGWAKEPASDSRYWIASVLALILTAAFVWLFKGTVGRSARRRNRPRPPAGSDS